MLHIALQNLEFFHHYKKRDKYKQREIDNKKIVHVSVVKCSQVQNEQKTYALVRETTPRYSIPFFRASAMQATCHNSLNRVRFSTSVMTWKKQNKAKNPQTQQPSIHHFCMKLRLPYLNITFLREHILILAWPMQPVKSPLVYFYKLSKLGL